MNLFVMFKFVYDVKNLNNIECFYYYMVKNLIDMIGLKNMIV